VATARAEFKDNHSEIKIGEARMSFPFNFQYLFLLALSVAFTTHRARAASISARARGLAAFLVAVHLDNYCSRHGKQYRRHGDRADILYYKFGHISSFCIYLNYYLLFSFIFSALFAGRKSI
jgi:hypothetical protein